MRTLLNPSSASPVLSDIALLIARVSLGVILMAHGWQKFTEWTISGTTENFAGMGIPLPGISAPFAATAELVGGFLLIIGLLAPVIALLNIITMIGALFMVHLDAGIFASDGGYELVWALAAGLAVIALMGAGRFSVDHLIASRTSAKAPATV
ncbi:DoxX family protein [Corynebacterium sputi]|uniref:DoxX family protein n=1 Tax=Corynebacterium sputi TaxID=489915 RepID=UPI00041AF87B|nr:DoxX family protein [Corynebacterium sputi]